MTCRFTAVMPVFNRSQYLRQAIDSVLGQTFTDFELITVDDGSTDDSPEILKSYGDRIRVVRQANQGPEVARNTGAALAQGEYLMMVDSDDLLLPHAMATYDRIIRAFNSPPLVLGHEIDFKDEKSIPPGAIVSNPVEVISYKDFLSKDTSLGVLVGSIVIRKSVFDEIGGFRNSTPETFHVEDANLILKAGTYGPFVVVKKPNTYLYRHHENNSFRNMNAITNGWIYVIRSERQGRYPGGWKRMLDRYAVIGGVCSFWALRFCWKQGQKKMALRVLWVSAPMVCAAVWKKALRYFRKPAQSIILQEQ